MRGMHLLLACAAMLTASACSTTPPDIIQPTPPEPVPMRFYETLAANPERALQTLNIVSPVKGSRCMGSYDPMRTTAYLNVPVRCTDGRKGSVLLDPSAHAGTVRLSDATKEYLTFEYTGPEEFTASLYDRKRPAPRTATPTVVASTQDSVTSAVVTPSAALPTSAPQTADPQPKAAATNMATVQPAAATATSTTRGSGLCQKRTDRDKRGDLCKDRSAEARAERKQLRAIAGK